jgi:hypothetical protein
MRRLMFAALLAAAPMLMLDSTTASACGWFGNRGYAPVTYSKAYRARAYTGASVAGWAGWGRWCNWGMGW